MEKRYQIFVSSTFRDLIDERQAVLKAVLEIDQMPAGMELFPAADDSAWTLIQDVIRSSDYYVLILGGRYGSTDAAGIGFTEKEYEFAVMQGIPVIPLLHQNPDNLAREKTETDEKAWKKLSAFRKTVETRHTCIYWDGSQDLKAKVIVSLTAAMKRAPRVGWVRADNIPTGATVSDVLALRDKVAELEAELQAASVSPPEGASALAHGSDEFDLRVEFVARDESSYPYEDTEWWLVITPSWDEIFAAVAPKMIDELSDRDLRTGLKKYFSDVTAAFARKDRKLKTRTLRSFTIAESEIDTCFVQLRALGLIRESVRKRSLKDTSTYWSLTPYGDHKMVQLRAIKRDQTQ